MRTLLGSFLLLACAGTTSYAQDVHALAAKVDAHYNHLRSLRAAFTETYSGMGQQRTEHGTLLLAKPGRMRWQYAGGKLFVLDGKSAVSYVPGDPQAQRISAKQLDDMRSPLRFLLGHTALEKELDGLHADPGPAGVVVLSGRPRYTTGTGESPVASMAITVQSGTGSITDLEVRAIDGAVTRFTLGDIKENVPVQDGDFRFVAPAGVTVLSGLPPV